MIGPVLTGLVFSAAVILLSLYKPEFSRIFMGFFFLLMGGGVNLPFIITQPYFVYQYGMTSRFFLYRNLTESVIGLNPVLFGVLLIVFEISVGILLLSRKGGVRAGLVLASLFILILVPVQSPQAAWAVSVPALLYLLKRDFPASFPEMLKERREGRKARQNSL